MFETNGFSLLDSTGDETQRLSEASRVGTALSAHQELFGRANTPVAEVAIAVNEWNYRLCDEIDDASRHLEYSTRGWHRYFWERGTPVDFINICECDDTRLESYRLIVLPFPLSISEELVERLHSYVTGGGTLLSEACIGRLDEFGRARRGELSRGARDLFGVEHESLQMVREPGNGTKWMPEERGWGEYAEPVLFEGTGSYAGTSLRANLYIQTFTCTSSQPLFLYNGRAAACSNEMGKGRAIILGTFTGHNGTAYKGQAPRDWLDVVCAEAGMAKPLGDKLLIRRRVSESAEAWILTNPTDDSVTESISAANYAGVEDPLGGRVSLEGGMLSVTVDALDARLLVLESALFSQGVDHA